MSTWSKDELRKVAEADDLHISPFREDGKTYGTPTWIWSVAVDDALYVRGYNGQKSSWYQAAVRQKAGPSASQGAKDMNKEPSAIKKNFGDFSPKLVQLTDDVLFGDVWERTELSKRDRSLVTVAALIAGGNSEQLPFHVQRAKEHGVTDAELIETITPSASYIGWP